MAGPSIFFSSTFWRTYWTAIRRSRHDRRSLNAALRITLSLLFFFGYYGALLWVFVLSDKEGRWIAFVTFSLVGGFGMLLWMSGKRDERAIDRADELAVDQTLRGRLAEDAFSIAVLLSRAGSEQMIKQKAPPEGVTVITRRVQLDKLRKLAKWDSLPHAVRDLLLLPDGHWSDEQVLSVRACFEVLRCLRWALFIDSELTPLPLLPKMDYKMSQQLFQEPRSSLTEDGCVPFGIFALSATMRKLFSGDAMQKRSVAD